MKIMGKFLNDYTFEHDFQQSLSFQEAFKCNVSSRNPRNTIDRFEMLNQMKSIGFDFKDLERIFESHKYL